VLQPFALPAGGNDVENRWSFLRFMFFLPLPLGQIIIQKVMEIRFYGSNLFLSLDFYGPIFWSFDFLTWVNSTDLMDLNIFHGNNNNYFQRAKYMKNVVIYDL
jgi:hypothetical protein